MDTATSHALILTAAAVLAWYLGRALLSRTEAHGTESGSQQKDKPLSAGDLEATLKDLYARRARYRLGVIACCALALVAYFYGGHRLLLLAPLLVACWCQYGVYKHRTTGRLTELMQQRLGRASLEGAAQNKHP